MKLNLGYEQIEKEIKTRLRDDEIVKLINHFEEDILYAEKKKVIIRLEEFQNINENIAPLIEYIDSLLNEYIRSLYIKIKE